MPRRRKITIRASELECFETLVRELHQRPEFAGFDPSSLHVWTYERYEPKLKDADAILRRFDYWLGVHKGERYLMANGSRLFNKKELAEALGVARPTLDRWITNGWLEPCRVQIKRHPLPVEQCQDPLKGLVLFQQLQRLARVVVPVEQVRAEKRLPHHVLLCVRQCG